MVSWPKGYAVALVLCQESADGKGGWKTKDVTLNTMDGQSVIFEDQSLCVNLGFFSDDS